MQAHSTDNHRLIEADRNRGGSQIAVDIPLENKVLLHDVAEALRGLAQVMDLQSGLKGVSEVDTLVRVKFEVRHTNNIIQAACRRYHVVVAGDSTETDLGDDDGQPRLAFG